MMTMTHDGQSIIVYDSLIDKLNEPKTALNEHVDLYDCLSPSDNCKVTFEKII